MSTYEFFKSLAFRLDPELAHEYTIKALEKFPQVSNTFFPPVIPKVNKYSLTSGLLNWSYPIGIAAGLDKNAQAIKFFDSLAIGNLEVGTVTLKPQKGNPRPRMWRYPDKESLRNSMGFPNAGSRKILKKIQDIQTQRLCLGVNIGKNKDTSIEQTPAEYAKLYEMFAPYCEYIAVNISSPNTPGLREFQQADQLKLILAAINEKKVKTPVLVKIAPDLDNAQIEEVVRISIDNKADGLIATNTTRIEEMGDGGVSGKLLYQKSHRVRALVLSQIKGQDNFSFIGVGGFSSFEDIKDFWKQGGRLTQVYTSFVYQGPQFFYQSKIEIDRLLKKYQCKTLESLLNDPQILKEI